MTIAEAIQSKNLVNAYPNRGITFVKGEGVYLIAEDGQKYLDFGSNFGVNLLGYDIPEIKDRIKKQVDTLINCHGSFANDQRSQATKALLGQIKQTGFPQLSRVLWANYGAEAVDAALKFALLATERERILAPHNDYHGKTLAALSTTSSNNGKYQQPFRRFLLPTDYFEFGDLESLEKVISNEHAALIIEPIQAEGGIVVPPEGFLPQVSRLCQKHGVLLIIDEIQTGLGRNGRFLSMQKYVRPLTNLHENHNSPPSPLFVKEGEAGFAGGGDSLITNKIDNHVEICKKYVESNFHCDILLLGKGLGGGLPVSAVLTTESVNKKILKGTHTSTTGGNPLSLAGVSAFLNYLQKDEIIKRSLAVSEYLFTQANQLQARFPQIISQIRGEGFMLGMQVTIPPMDVLKALQKLGIIALPCNHDTVRFLPPLIIEKSHVDELTSALERIFEKNE